MYLQQVAREQGLSLLLLTRVFTLKFHLRLAIVQKEGNDPREKIRRAVQYLWGKRTLFLPFIVRFFSVKKFHHERDGKRCNFAAAGKIAGDSSQLRDCLYCN